MTVNRKGAEPIEATAPPEVTAEQAYRNFSDVLNRVYRGESIIITKYGKPFARIGPVAA